jgi:hypothetical protein
VTCFEWKEWPRVESTWVRTTCSALQCPFSATVGGAICDWVVDQIDPVYKQVVSLCHTEPDDRQRDCSYRLPSHCRWTSLGQDIRLWRKIPRIGMHLTSTDFLPTCAYLLASLMKQEKESDLSNLLLPSLSHLPTRRYRSRCGRSQKSCPTPTALSLVAGSGLNVFCRG